MASLKYFTKRDSNLNTIYLRFTHGRNIDLTKTTSLLIDIKNWNNHKGIVKNTADFQDKKNLQNKLNTLREYVLNKFNNDYSTGVTINGNWLTDTINKHFDQSNSKNDLNYFRDYITFFIDTLPNKILNNGKIGVSQSTYKKYKGLQKKVIEYELKKRKRLKLSDINLKFHKDFIYYLHNNLNLNYNTIGVYLSGLKAICRDAKRYKLKISDEIDYPEFRIPNQKTTFITLSIDEINKIHNHNFNTIPYLNNARNWLIISVWTGARIGDLLNLTMSNIKNNFIEYTSQKTNQKIIVPLHNQVKQIIEKLGNKLPHKISSQKLNNYIKEVCKEVGLKNKVKGSKMNKDTKRKELGTYEKWELVTSHIGRRSFATNHYGKLPTPVLMSITGHTTEKMFLKYIGKTPKDHAEILKEYWSKEKQKEKKETVLNVVKTAN